MPSHEELRDEVEILLGAARGLAPDTDRYLAETFVSRIERRRPAHVAVLNRLMSAPRRAAALALAVVLAIGTPLAIHAYTAPSVTTCIPTIVKIYPSKAAANADAHAMQASGYRDEAGIGGGSGATAIQYGLNGGCGGIERRVIARLR